MQVLLREEGKAAVQQIGKAVGDHDRTPGPTGLRPPGG
jgi:hypothetical protein